jgi:hypothetical protein
MGITPRDYIQSTDIATDFVEGRLISPRSQLKTDIIQNPTFKKMVVLDVVSDPVSVLDINDKKIEYWRNVLSVSNMKYASVLPRNTVVGHFIYSLDSPIFAFPFFPSHFALPCKPGETVWVMVPDPNASDNPSLVFWMCRVTEPHFADDVNHTHSPRVQDISFAGVDKSSKKDRSENGGKTSPYYELRNGNILLEGNDRRRIDRNNLYIETAEEEDYFENLVKLTDSARVMQYEAIPRFKKRPGDIVLEGTNNSLIVLGTDRTSSLAKYEDTKTVLGFSPSFNTKDMQGDAGSIDLVVGRGQTKETLGKVVSTTSIFGAEGKTKGKEIKKELGKAEDELSKQEGDFDLINDRSRIQISQKTKVDTNYGLATYNSSFSTGNTRLGTPIADNADGDSAIVIKTDKIRLIARSDVEILVSSYEETVNAKEAKIKNELVDTTKWASIVIKSNGDIVFKPSALGYIKLGGDDANLGVICSDTAVIPSNGTVEGPPMITTMGGQFAGSSATGIGENRQVLATGQAKYASKVLIK